MRALLRRKRTLAVALLTSALIAFGLALLRARFAPPRSLAAEFLTNRLTYLYVFAATAIVFSILGYIFGRQADELRRLSTTDPLTGLGNRRGLYARLRDEWRRSRRYGSPLSLLLIDVDGLKQINDERGHAAGDQVLRNAARAIKSTLRATDYGARWGGDEFAIVAPNTNRAAAHRLGERLLARMGRHSRDDDVPLSASIGIAVTTADDGEADTPKALIDQADGALYKSKTSGRNRVSVA
jgi:two-component system, cell cycle response regulator